jgi:hypothetical protein
MYDFKRKNIYFLVNFRPRSTKETGYLQWGSPSHHWHSKKDSNVKHKAERNDAMVMPVGLPKRLTDNGGERLISLCKDGGDIYQESYFMPIMNTEQMIKREFLTVMTGRLSSSNVHRFKHASPHACWSTLPYADTALTAYFSVFSKRKDIDFLACEPQSPALSLPHMIVLDFIKSEMPIESVTCAKGMSAYSNVYLMGSLFGADNINLIGRYAVYWPYLLIGLEKLVRNILAWQQLSEDELNATFEAYWAITKLLLIEHMHSATAGYFCGLVSMDHVDSIKFIDLYRENLGFSPDLFRMKDAKRVIVTTQSNGMTPGASSVMKVVKSEKTTHPNPVESLSLGMSMFYLAVNREIAMLFSYLSQDKDSFMFSFGKDKIATLFAANPHKMPFNPIESCPQTETDFELTVYSLSEVRALSDLFFSQAEPKITGADKNYREWFVSTLTDYVFLESGIFLPPSKDGMTAIANRVKPSALRFLKNCVSASMKQANDCQTDILEPAYDAIHESNVIGSRFVDYYLQLMTTQKDYYSELGKKPQDLREFDPAMKTGLISTNNEITKAILGCYDVDDDNGINQKSSLIVNLTEYFVKMQEASLKIESNVLANSISEMSSLVVDKIGKNEFIEASALILKIADTWRHHLDISVNQDEEKSKILAEKLKELDYFIAIMIDESVSALNAASQKAVEAVPAELEPSITDAIKELEAAKNELAALKDKNGELTNLVREKQEEIVKMRKSHKRKDAKLHSLSNNRSAPVPSASFKEIDNLAARLVSTLESTDILSVMKLAESFSMGRISFTDSAIDSASDYRRQEYSPVDLMSALIKLSDLYFDAYKESGDSSAKQVFGNAYSANESEPTMNQERLRRMREFDILGRKKIVTQHLSINNYFRLYFTIEGDKIIIPYLGKHLEVVTTN